MTENTKQTVVDKIKKELEEEYAEKNKDSKHLERVITHIENVQKSCLKLSKRLMESEETYEVGFKHLKIAIYMITLNSLVSNGNT